MIKVFYIFAFILVNLVASGCSVQKKTQVLTSPCVSTSGGPCERYNVNDWWLLGEDKPRLIKAVV